MPNFGASTSRTYLPVAIALRYVDAGDYSRALDWLEKAVKLGISRAQIDNDPDLPRLQGRERYRSIVKLAS